MSYNKTGITGGDAGSTRLELDVDPGDHDEQHIAGDTGLKIENELKKAINYERNRQLNQYSKIYYNKIKKNLDFNG